MSGPIGSAYPGNFGASALACLFLFISENLLSLLTDGEVRLVDPKIGREKWEYQFSPSSRSCFCFMLFGFIGKFGNNWGQPT